MIHERLNGQETEKQGLKVMADMNDLKKVSNV